MHSTAFANWKKAAATTIAVGAFLGLASAHAEARSRGFKDSTLLTATGVDADARGKVQASVKDDDARFVVSTAHLGRNATYEVIVGGVKVASFVTSGGGSGKIRLRTHPRGRDGLLGFDPRSADVVIRDAGGHDVLLGTVAGDDGSNDADVICCVPDDDGTECEDRTPDECVARGGTVSTATSCVPNPCDGATPPAGGDILCCLPDDSGAECEDRTTAECAAQGGTVVQATSCSPNPCAAVPPADPDVRCCLPDDSGTECEDRTADECAAEGGVDRGVGVCAPDSCDGVTFPGSWSGGDDHGGSSGGGNSGPH
jgi:hypothetical protein